MFSYHITYAQTRVSESTGSITVCEETKTSIHFMFPERLVVHFAKYCTSKGRKPGCKATKMQLLKTASEENGDGTNSTTLDKTRATNQKIDSFLLII